jgi:hypothetical protein
MKIYPAEVDLFHADGRTDGHNESLKRDFRNFANALKPEVAVANMDKNRWKTQLPIQTETQTAIKNI